MRLYKSKRDGNEPDIVDALERVGAYVIRIDASREGGQPDLLVYHRGRWFPIEVKQRKGRLTEAQRRDRERAPYPIARTPAEALAVLGLAVAA